MLRETLGGYQIKGASGRKRLDKFFYNGFIETVALSEVQVIVGKLGRLGIGLETEVEAWVRETEEDSLVCGKIVTKLQKECYSNGFIRDLQERGCLFDPPPVRTKINSWVSDLFGIAVGVKVLWAYLFSANARPWVTRRLSCRDGPSLGLENRSI